MSIHLSKCHSVRNHMSWLNYLLQAFKNKEEEFEEVDIPPDELMDDEEVDSEDEQVTEQSRTDCLFDVYLQFLANQL